jgi:hypothetical protein
MGELFRFLGRHVVASLFGAAGVILLTLGYADQAEAIATRFAPWQFQALGAAFFVIFVVMVLVSYDRKHLVEAGAPERSVPPARGTPDPERERRREEQAVTYALNSARDDARCALADTAPSGQKRTAERQLPKLRSAMLSAHKLFGTPIPPEDENALLEVEFHCRMIEQMLPYLRKGHIEEARNKGQEFIDRIVNRRGTKA